MLWIYINVTIFSTEQAILHMNSGTSNCLCRFGDNRSLKQLWLLSFLFKCLSVCVFDVYVKRQFLLLTKISWFKLGRLLHKESFHSLFASRMEHNIFSQILCTTAPLWQLLKYPLKMHSHHSDIGIWKIYQC